MQTIPLQAIPNQAFNILLDNHNYNIEIKEIRGLMAATIARDNVIIQSGTRIVSGTPLMPYQYQEDDAGNFIMLTANQEYPYYTQFGISQYLVYASEDELNAIRAGI
jgi:uncharacterized protein DUF6983